MITQCPSCQTRFRLPLDQVATSRGEVLCGECHAQFNALDYLVIEEGIKPGKPTLTVRASKGDENVNSNTLFLPIDEDVIANLLSEREPDESPEEANTPAETSVIEEELSPQLTPITRQATPTAADVLLQETLKRAEESHVQEERIEKEELSEEPVEIVFEKKEEPIPSQPSSPPEKYQLSQNLEESPDEQAHF
ncbi:MAG: zinc-ribbon domain-containing protein, partial [Chromatiales bacterium]|nr:zinc-ribbon domain-containing protein [Chromatiales bacterium]